MNKIFITITLLIMLFGCDVAQDMKEIFNKQETAIKYVKENYNLDAQIAFNITNDTLTQVSLVLNAQDVRNRSVEELEAIANDMVSKVFKAKPQMVIVQLYSQPK